MAVTRNAADCPLPQVSTTLRLLSDAFASSSGTAPASRSFVQGESANLRPKLNENALRLDLATRFGGGVRAVGQGLAVTAAALVGTVAAGQCLIDGIAEIPASVTGLAMVDNTWNYFWVQQAPGGTATVVVTQSTTAPSNSVFIGAVQVTGGVAGTPDTSGVVYARGGLRLRETADAGAPGDSPPAQCMIYTKTAGGLYLWDGTAHQLAGTAVAIYAQTLEYSASESATPIDTTGATTGQVLTVPATPGDPPEWTDLPSPGTGTVTSVGLTMPTGLSVGGAPVTNSGTLAVTLGVSGLLKGDSGAIVAASAGTDYLAPSGDGSALTNLSASALATGTVPTARLGTGTANSSAYLRGDQTWASLPAASTSVAGIVELATNGETASGVAVQGNDSRLSDARTPTAHNHAAADINSGTMATARLGSGTADNTTFLRGDQTWAVPSGGGGDVPFLAFNPEQARLPSSNPAANVARNAHPLLAFDDTTQEFVVFAGVLPTTAFPTTDDIRVRIIWVAASAVADDVVWRANWERRDATSFRPWK